MKIEALLRMHIVREPFVSLYMIKLEDHLMILVAKQGKNLASGIL